MNLRELEGKVDAFLLEELEDSESITLETILLPLTYNRFDLAFKLLYINGLFRKNITSFERETYKKHIKAFSLGRFSEQGSNKKSFDDYEKTFFSLYTDIHNNGFNDKKSYVPLASDGSILNGAHRTAISIHLKKPVAAIKTSLPPIMYDYSFFKNRGVSDAILDEVALKYIENSDNCFLAMLWPSAKEHDHDTEALINRIVYKKKVSLNYLGAHNLLSEAYQNESWLGSEKKGFPGIKNKLTKCFPNFDSIKVYLFQKNSLEETIKLKENIRALYGIKKHSIHITDSQEETLRLGRLLYSKNGIHFLNNAKPYKYESAMAKINIFDDILNLKSLSFNNYVLDSGLVLAIYGLRDATDIDYLTIEKIIVNNDEVDYHEKELPHHKIKEEELIINPYYHFWFKGVKFISLPQIYVMKFNRGESKDIADNALIKNLLEKNKLKSFFTRLKYEFYFVKAKLHSGVIVFWIRFSKSIGIYPQARKIYRRYK